MLIFLSLTLTLSCLAACTLRLLLGRVHLETGVYRAMMMRQKRQKIDLYQETHRQLCTKGKRGKDKSVFGVANGEGRYLRLSIEHPLPSPLSTTSEGGVTAVYPEGMQWTPDMEWCTAYYGVTDTMGSGKTEGGERERERVEEVVVSALVAQHALKY
ncbi:hypothetical protein KIPB_002753 [Kipferlia bialata]|uniref:Uncharacterized protein n=1 Tax=Kipferlia bialata TaxID=797122 RepID=A0A9K3CST6_9EUKA|nr:hypothetical protein KIPB_002753 [Kipferlia bialata]|eukprot:g2753.t1